MADPAEATGSADQQDLSSLIFSDNADSSAGSPPVPEVPQEQAPAASPAKILPDDPRLLDALKMQESSGNSYAVGPATRHGTAKGPYQFIDSTWNAYADAGDNVFNEVDSRKNAGRYLNDLYKKYDGDIQLTLAAYNTGEPNVDAAISKADSKNFGDIAPYLPTQTQNYVPGVLGKYNKTSPVLADQVAKAKLPGEIDNKGFAEQLQPIVNSPEYQSLDATDQLATINKLYQKNIYSPEVKESLKKLSDNIWSAATPDELAQVNAIIGRPDRASLENEKDPTKKLVAWKNEQIDKLEKQGIAPELFNKPLNDIFQSVSEDEMAAAKIRNMGKLGQFVTHIGKEFQNIATGVAQGPADAAAFTARAMSDVLGVNDYSTTISKLPDTLLGDKSRLGNFVVDDKGYVALDEKGQPIHQWDVGLFRAVGNILGVIGGGVGLKMLGAGETAVTLGVSGVNVLQQANNTFQSVYAATGDKEKSYFSAFLSMPAAEIGSLFQLSQISKFGTATTEGLSQINKFRYFAKEAAANAVKGGPVFGLQDVLTQGAESVSTGQAFDPNRFLEAVGTGAFISGLVGPAIKGIEYGGTLKREAIIKKAVTSQLQDFQYSHATEVSLPVEEKFVDTRALEVLGQTVVGKDESGNVRVAKTGAIPEESTTPDESLTNVTKYLTPTEIFHYNEEKGQLLEKAREAPLTESEQSRLHDIDEKLIGTEDPTYFNKVKANEADFIAKEKEAGLPSRGVHWDEARKEWVNDAHPHLSDPFLKAALGLEYEGQTLEAPSKDPASVTRPQTQPFPFAVPQKPLSNKFTPRRFFSIGGETPIYPKKTIEAAKKIIGLAAGRGATIKEGGRLKKGGLGYYSPAAAVIRVRSLRDIPTFVHEVTHAVDHDLQDLVIRTANADPVVGQALKEQAQTFYPDPRVVKNKTLALREGITTFLQNYITGDPVHTDLLNWWNGKFKQDHPEIHAQYEEVKKLSDAYYSQTYKAREEGFQKVEKPGIYEKFKNNFLNARAWQILSDKDFAFREGDLIVGRSGSRFDNKSYRGFIDALDQSSKAYVTKLVSGDVFSDRQGNVIPGQKTLRQIFVGMTPEEVTTLRNGLVAYNAEAMIGRGQNPGLSKQEVTQAIGAFETAAAGNPKLHIKQQEIYDWWTKTVDTLTDGSPHMQRVIQRVRDSNLAVTGQEHGYYVPFQRQGFEEGIPTASKGNETLPSGVLSRKGSDRPIENIFDSFEKQAQSIGIAGLKNQLYDRLVHDLKNGVGAGNLIEQVPARMEKKFQAQYIDILEAGVKALKKSTGIDTGKEHLDFVRELSNATNSSLADILTTTLNFFGPETTFKGPTKGYTVIAIPKASGKGHQFYEIHPDVMKAFNGIEQTGILSSPAFEAIVRTPKRLLQVGATTLNPVFQVKNFFGRDWQSALLLQEKGFHAGAFFKNMLGEIVDQTVTKATGRFTGPAAYAARIGLNTATRAGAAKELAYVARGKGLGSKIWNGIETGLETLEWYGSLGENTTRLAAMQAKAEQLGIDLHDPKTVVTPLQHIDLALAYKNSTVNFSKRGSGVTITALREAIPFFGARLAATTQSIEMAGTAPKRAAALAATSFALGMYAYITNHKKDWYDDMSSTSKANTFVVDFQNHAVGIPLDNFNAVFHALGVTAAQQFIQQSDNESTTLEHLREALNQASPIDLPLNRTGILGLASAPSGPLIQGILEEATNTKFWTGAPIVDNQHKAPTQQFTPNTSRLMIEAGRELTMSPDRIEYFVGKFEAGPLKMEKFFEAQMGFAPANKDEAANFLVRAFTREASNAAIQDQSRTKFYDTVAEANQNKYQETEVQGDARKEVNRTAKAISALNKQIGVEEDKDKREQLYLQRRDLYKQGASAWRSVKAQAAESSQ